MRWMSPDSAHWSGSSACRIVTFGPLVTWQSSNSARTAGLARPAKEISYVRDPGNGGALSAWFVCGVSVPGHRRCGLVH